MLTGIPSNKAPISIAVMSQLRRNNPHGEDACPMQSQVPINAFAATFVLGSTWTVSEPRGNEGL